MEVKLLIFSLYLTKTQSGTRIVLEARISGEAHYVPNTAHDGLPTMPLVAQVRPIIRLMIDSGRVSATGVAPPRSNNSE